MVDAVFKQAGKDKQGFLTFQDFKTIMFSDNSDVWKSAVLNLEGNKFRGQSVFRCWINWCLIKLECKTETSLLII